MRIEHESSAGMPDLVESLKVPRCGGPLTMSPGDVIVTCPYCGSASRLRSEKAFLLRHAMLSARLDEAGASAAIEAWFSRGFLKPADPRKGSRIASPECVYIPLFLFVVDVTAVYFGVLTPAGTNQRPACPGP